MTYKSRKLAVADVETSQITEGELPRTKFWGFFDGATYRRFKTTAEFCKFLRQSQEAFLILHHSNFDVIQLLVDGAEVEIVKSHNGKLIVSSYRGQTFLNSYAVFPVSLGSIFSAFGYEKTALTNLAKRNYEDCVNGLECFLKLDAAFETVAGVSAIHSHTIASAAFRAAEKVAGRLPKCLQLENAYRGGRVDAFDLRKHDASYFDINSSYPFSIMDAPTKSKLLRVRVTTRDWHCPFFDADERERLLFPNGTFETWIYSDVLERYVLPYAEATRVKIVERFPVASLSWFAPIKPLIANVYRLKQDHAATKDAVYMACKLFLNSLYGRIGLRGERETARFMDSIPNKDDVTFYKIGKRFLVFAKVYEEPRSNFPLAAYVTDNARGRLFQGIKRSGALYVDTDSIYTERRRLGLRVGAALGEWKFEDRQPFQALNVKDYVFGKHEVLKGGSEFTEWTLKRFASGKTPRLVARERQTELQKRRVLPSGATEPIQVNR